MASRPVARAAGGFFLKPPSLNPQSILALNAFDPAAATSRLDPEREAQIARRTALFGAASVLFYDEPLEFVRGEGCRLFDAVGTDYLDAYNNVPSVGHCHPRVVEAVSRQLALLNVHNRYLHPDILRYAERLLATLPPTLSNITFTCTGSESNDLALRLAAHITGARGIIVTRGAYHGNTALVTSASPSLMRQLPADGAVRFVDLPDARRVPPQDLANHVLRSVQTAIEELDRGGHGVSALLVDSIFSSDGVFADPPGFLQPAVDAVRHVRGMLIADEVQCGFGRTGAAFWGFERHGLIPDLVTLGKPMGNGYPMGAVISRPELLEAYCAEFGYFNTFGGSPVAAAAGLAVLDVLEEEGLQESARRVGAHLKQALEELAVRWPALVEVRGVGLYLGIQVQSTSEQLPAAVLVRRLINGMRARRVLIGAAGAFADVLKIRPPLCFSEADAEQLVGALEGSLLEIFAAP
jgi:4-aminobutyrate aminotransferase-like enzyme